MSSVKESNYFAYDGEEKKIFSGGKVNNKFRFKTLDEYRQLFMEAGVASVVGEVSTLYLEKV